MATQKTRRKILETFLDLVGERGWSGFGMAELAGAADVKLSVLRAEFPDKTACLRAFLSEVDQKVLDRVDPDMADEPVRDRLFDVLMTRLDVMADHKPAICAIGDAMRRDPGLALRLNRELSTSARWMLTAAGIPVSGLRAGMMAQGLVVAFARVVDTWLDDEDPGLARTMATLDRQLDEGESWLGRIDKVGRMISPLFRRGFGSRSRRGTRDRDAGASETPADGEPASPAA